MSKMDLRKTGQKEGGRVSFEQLHSLMSQCRNTLKTIDNNFQAINHSLYGNTLSEVKASDRGPDDTAYKGNMESLAFEIETMLEDLRILRRETIRCIDSLDPSAATDEQEDTSAYKN